LRSECEPPDDLDKRVEKMDQFERRIENEKDVG
jgi:hypothetical protein